MLRQLGLIASHNASVSSLANCEITRGWEAIRKDTDDLVGKEGSFQISVGSMDLLNEHYSVKAPER